MACEKCWRDAYIRWINNPHYTQAEHYAVLLEERKDSPCTTEEENRGKREADARQ